MYGAGARICQALKPLDQNRRNLRYFESISLKASAVGRIVFGLG
jgi:hypothetical protein